MLEISSRMDPTNVLSGFDFACYLGIRLGFDKNILNNLVDLSYLFQTFVQTRFPSSEVQKMGPISTLESLPFAFLVGLSA